MAADAFKQLRSMILLELCCPPLPVMAIRQETGQQTVTNTHDMLSVFMITAFKRQNAVENDRRKASQIEIEADYLKGLKKCSDFTQAYAHMAQFSASYLATYLEGTGFSKQDIRVLPPDYISPILKEEIRSYCKALMLLANTTESCRKDFLPQANLNDLFMSCVNHAISKTQLQVPQIAMDENENTERNDMKGTQNFLLVQSPVG